VGSGGKKERGPNFGLVVVIIELRGWKVIRIETAWLGSRTLSEVHEKTRPGCTHCEKISLTKMKNHKRNNLSLSQSGEMMVAKKQNRGDVQRTAL
jgi:hypothetical protein